MNSNVNKAWPAANPPSSEEAVRLAETLVRADVRAAAERIAGRVRRTPVLRVPEIDAAAGCEVWLKAENLQHIGAFKARGAMHAVGRIDPKVRERGILTFSSGNHAQAVALAAQAYGIPAHICMPEDAPPIKAAAVRRMGATVQLAGLTSDDRKAACLEQAAKTGGIVIQPFDHPDIVCGAGTATLELREQVREASGAELDGLIVPVGGGGVIAGACLASRDAKGRAFPIYSAEPNTCDAMARSIEAGERVAVEPGPTLADGLKPVRVGQLNFEIARRDIAGCLRVDDEALGMAFCQILIRSKTLVEPSGAAGLAALLGARARGELDGLERIGVILTGGNLQPELVARLVEQYGDQV
jgi:threonine dehydratase